MSYYRYDPEPCAWKEAVREGIKTALIALGSVLLLAVTIATALAACIAFD